jgi:hypothetical protein
LNWTNGYQANITITGNGTNIVTNTSNIILEIFNATTSFVANYSQYNSYTTCLDSVNFLLIDSNTSYGNVSGPINATGSYNSLNFTLIYNVSSHLCSPGRYFIRNLMIRNYTNSTENLNVSVFLDIPISANSTDNPLNNVTGIGTFGTSGHRIQMPIYQTLPAL